MPREDSRQCIRRNPYEDRGEAGLCVISTVQLCHYQEYEVGNEMLRGGLHIECTPAGCLFLSYWDKTTASTSIQSMLYADDLTLVAETRREL